MNKHSLIAASLLLASAGAMAAGSVSDDFVVSVAFTSSCKVTTAAADLAFTHTAFDAAQTKSTTTVFSCTRNLAAPTFSFDTTGTTQTGSAAAVTGTAITGEGVIAGLRYTLKGTTSRSAGNIASAGTTGANATAGSDGSADLYTVAIDATIGGNQAGDAASSTISQTRTLLISY
jgi:hypothetical protein